MKATIASSGVSKKNKFDLSSFHATTLDFGRTIPTNIIECVPGDKFDIEFVQKFLMSPLVVPTFGNCRFLTRAFWVPNRVLTPAWESFIAEKNDPTVQKTLKSFTNNDLVKFFVTDNPGQFNVGAGNDYVVRQDASVSRCDIKLSAFVAGAVSYYKFNFTEKGAWIYDCLLSLGYGINWVVSDTNTNADFTSFDFLPILAFCRCLYDYIYPSAYVTQQGFGWLFEDLGYPSYTASVLKAMADLLYAPYEQDHYTSCWQTMQSVTRNSIVYNSLNQMGAAHMSHSNDGLQAIGDDNNTRIQASTSGQVTTLSNASMRAMMAISDVLMRYNVAGSRFVERMAAKFGFKTNAFRINQSRFLKSFVIDSNFQEVTNMSQADGSILGELAGKGSSAGKGSLKFECDEYGYLIFISQIIPTIGYYQGRAHHTLARNPYEYYDGAFDNLYMSPVRNDELFADFQGDATNTFSDYISHGGLPAGVFGFHPFYSHYKYGRDCLTGDFRRNSRNVGLESYHTLRILPQPSTNSPLVLNSSFLQVLPHDYDRIFSQGSVTGNAIWSPRDSSVDILTDVSGHALIFVSSSNVGYVVCKGSSGYSYSSLTYANTSAYISSHGSVDAGVINNLSGSNNFDVRFNGSSLLIVVTAGVASPDAFLSQPINGVERTSYDHFVGYFNFRVTAYRNMLSISESLPMFNKQGEEITLSYEGTQL